LHSLNGVAFGIINLMHISRKFELLLDAYRRPDGSRWTGQQLDEATDGVVPRSYVTNLSKGRIASPGYEKMAAIAKAMGFPPGTWFEDDAGKEPASDWGLAGALRDETIQDTAREMSRLSKRERRLVLGIVRQFADDAAPSDQRHPEGNREQK
jgi:transcriptional regulator with XRE-family HTH domain